MRGTTTDLASIESLRDATHALCVAHGVAQLELFGSRATGTMNAASDVDLLVEFLPEANAGFFEMGALQDALQERLGCRVDLLSRRAVEGSRNPYRRQAILAHPVTLYAR
jgi:predicted nucleotidyltransferase